MPKDCAIFQTDTGVIVPIIIVNDMAANASLDSYFFPEQDKHGFMVFCKGQTLYWNTQMQDFLPDIINTQI